MFRKLFKKPFNYRNLINKDNYYQQVKLGGDLDMLSLKNNKTKETVFFIEKIDGEYVGMVKGNYTYEAIYKPKFHPFEYIEVDEEMAVGLEKLTGISKETWVALQERYDGE